jgi:hypothetical protein
MVVAGTASFSICLLFCYRQVAVRSTTERDLVGNYSVTVNNVTSFVYTYDETYGVFYTDFFFTAGFYWWAVADVFLLVVILLLNLLILLKMSETTKRKMTLAKKESAATVNATATRSVLNARRSQRKKKL